MQLNSWHNIKHHIRTINCYYNYNNKNDIKNNNLAGDHSNAGLLTGDDTIIPLKLVCCHHPFNIKMETEWIMGYFG